MAHDDEAHFLNSSDPESTNRSVAGLAPVPTEVSATVDIHDDDALADALAAEYTLIATSAIPIVSQRVAAESLASEDWVNAMVESGDASAQPDLVTEPDAPAEFAAPAEVDSVADPENVAKPEQADDSPMVSQTGTAPTWDPPALRESDVKPARASEAEDRGEPEVKPQPAAESAQSRDAPDRPTFVSPFDPPTSTDSTPDLAAAPWSLFPAPDPSHAVELADGPPQFLAQSPVEDWPAPSFDPPVEPGAEISDQPAGAEDHVPLVESEKSLENHPYDEPDDGSAAVSELVSTLPAWAPGAEPRSEWDAVAAAAPSITGHVAEDHDVNAHLETADDGIETFDVEENPEDEPEQFPWIVAAAAAAAATPLVAPVERDPFNWSINATGKVSYLDESPADPDVLQDPDADVGTAVEPEPQRQPESQDSDEAPTSGQEPQALDTEHDPQRMFSPPALIEPLASAQVSAAYLDLPSAPPAYLPVGDAEIEVEADESAAGSMFFEAMQTGFDGPVPSTTGSISVIDQAYEQELDDDVDDTDRAFANLLANGDGAGASRPAVAAPSGPISTVRIADNEPVFFDDAPIGQRVFSLEHSGLEPTPVEVRAGHAVRLFWLWFSANSSIVSVALGAVVFAAGMSLRQSIIAILGGVALSFFPLALTTLAGKRSGQPTMVVSRATFGLLGNVVPAALAVVSRLFWGAVLLWLLGGSVAAILVTTGLGANTQQLTLITIAIAFLIALLIAFIGFPLLARMQLILTIVAVVLIVGLIALTAKYINIPQALTVADGSWALSVGGAVLVFSFVGLVWAHSGADLARYQRPSSTGASSMLFATFGTAIPASVLIGYGALLAASDSGIATGFVTQPMLTIAGLLPEWYPIPLIAATALSLLSGVVVTLYSGGLALQSAGVKLTRQLSVVAVGAVLAGLAVLMTMTVGAGIGEVFRDFATTLAVPTAAWIGIFGSEMMIRNRRFDSESLLKRGGVYSDVRWINLGGFVLISAIGLGLTTATVSWLSWQGYAFPLVGVPLDGDIASTDLGVIVALVLGLVLPLAAGVPAIRRQESLRA